jgi:hypothetical protein
LGPKNVASAESTFPKTPTVPRAPVPEDTGELSAADRPQAASSPEPVEMPWSLVEELGRLLGQALAADIRQFPNLAELRTSPA